MRNLAIGLTTGLLVGFAGTALAAQFVREVGYLSGWFVIMNGETLCADPYVWPVSHEIECD